MLAPRVAHEPVLDALAVGDGVAPTDGDDGVVGVLPQGQTRHALVLSAGLGAGEDATVVGEKPAGGLEGDDDGAASGDLLHHLLLVGVAEVATDVAGVLDRELGLVLAGARARAILGLVGEARLGDGAELLDVEADELGETAAAALVHLRARHDVLGRVTVAVGLVHLNAHARLKHRREGHGVARAARTLR